MEIIQTGSLERINYERTEDVEAVNVFKGIYGVGESLGDVALRYASKS